MAGEGVSVSDERPDNTLPEPNGPIYRHRLVTRIWHWTNALSIIVMLMSGLMIFNAHPRLYWGQYGANFDHAWLQIGATATTGYLRIGTLTIDTTGVLGRWTDSGGNVQLWAFPSWATIPSGYSLALGRRWHFAFALILAFALLLFMIASLINRHFQRDLRLRARELPPRHLWHDVKSHLRLDFHADDPAAFNTLQKISYVAVIFGLIPGLILSGLTMSPGMDAAWPWLLDLFGGRQSARSVHFICAMLIAGFIVIHLLLVLLAGPVNEIRSMITGWSRLPREREK
jgi:thiosulfate reductase cytochrome b subunit